MKIQERKYEVKIQGVKIQSENTGRMKTQDTHRSENTGHP
jgi:hypothetical protein